MAENYIKPEEVSPEEAQNVLSFLNSAKSAQEIAKTVEIPEERDVGDITAQHILDKRNALGGFTDLKQVAEVKGVGPERFTEIVTTLRGTTSRGASSRGITDMDELFSLTPLNPHVDTTDLKASDVPCVNAYMFTFGGVTHYASPLRLNDQYSNNEIIIGNDAVPLSNKMLPKDCQKNCGIQVLFTAFNVDKYGHYHIRFQFRRVEWAPKAQFFVDHVLVDEHELVGDQPDNHPLDILCEGRRNVLVNLWVRIASNDWRSSMAFRGVDCYGII